MGADVQPLGMSFPTATTPSLDYPWGPQWRSRDSHTHLEATRHVVSPDVSVQRRMGTSEMYFRVILLVIKPTEMG